MKCIVGLGNPGKKYDSTRHNIGFDAIDSFLETNSMLNIVEEGFRKGDLYKGILNGIPFLLCKPNTFMNLSGEAVRELRKKYGVTAEDILIAYDDMDFDFGTVKLKPKGSAGGHNGVADIIAKCGTNEIKRLRIGIDRPPKGYDISKYVLQKFPKEELDLKSRLTDITDDIIENYILEDTFENVMGRFNNKKIDME